MKTTKQRRKKKQQAASARQPARTPTRGQVRARGRGRPQPRPRARGLRKKKKAEAPADAAAMDLRAPENAAALFAAGEEATAERLADFLDLLRGGMPHAEALLRVGLSWRSISRLLCGDKAFERQYEEARRVGFQAQKMRVSDTNLRSATDGVIERTTTNGPDGFRETVRIRPSDRALQRELHRTAPGIYMPLAPGMTPPPGGEEDFEALVNRVNERMRKEGQSSVVSGQLSGKDAAGRTDAGGERKAESGVKKATDAHG